MRVPTITTYNQCTYLLNRLTTDLNKANEVVSKEYKINTASDDPSGMAQLLDIDSSERCQEQFKVNIHQGQTVLTSAETAMDAMADQLLEIRQECAKLANASANPTDRADAAENMSVYLDGLLDLANTEAYGGYVFAGDRNQVAPFGYDDRDNPTGVIYTGSDNPTCVKTGKDTVVTLDCCGSEMFYEDEIVVDGTNNQIYFEEDPGTGAENILIVDATIPSGTYSREELARVVENTMTQASLEEGYGIGYSVSYDSQTNCFSMGTDGRGPAEMTTDLIVKHTETVRISSMEIQGGSFTNPQIEVRHPSALTEFTPKPEGTAPLTLTYTEEGHWTVENDPGYGLPYTIEGDGQTLDLDMDDDGVADVHLDLDGQPQAGTTVAFDIVPGVKNRSLLPDLGFDGPAVSIEPARSSVPVSTTFTVVAGTNDCVDFTETLVGESGQSAQLTAVIAPGVYPDPVSYAMAVEDALEAASARNGNRVNYEVVYTPENQAFTIREDTDTGRRLEGFDLLFSSGTHAGQSAGPDLGFGSADAGSGPVTGKEATWSLFDTVFDIQDALARDDVDGLQRAITRLDNHYRSITGHTAAVGISSAGLTASEYTASDTGDSLEIQRSDVRDADMVKAISDLNATQTVYEAALSSCASIMGLSLVDYM